MMRCPPFAYRAPESLFEAASILAAEGSAAMLLAGGTDVIPSMKRRTHTPAVLVALRRIRELRAVAFEGGGGVTLGAGVTLADIAAEPLLRPYAALQRAAAQVATTHIRNVGTLGGNLCLDTRCNYYDQGHEWRQAIGFCKKKEGETCWVAPGSPRCWAVSSTDLAPALVALGATVTLVRRDPTAAAPAVPTALVPGEPRRWAHQRVIPLLDLYRDDGIEFLARRADEIIADVRLPEARELRSTYWKMRRRESFDFPVLGVAAALRLDGDGVVEEARLVLGAVASHPVLVEAAGKLVGCKLTDEAIGEVADAAFRQAKPLDNTDFQIGWRKRVARTFIVGALRELRGDDPATLGVLARRVTAHRLPLVG